MNLITVRSPKGGVGVSMVAASIANIATQRGVRVAVIQFGSDDSARIWLGIDPVRNEDSSSFYATQLVSKEGVLLKTIDASRAKEAVSAIIDLQSRDYTVIVDIQSDAAGQLECLSAPDVNLWVMVPEAPCLAKLPTLIKTWGSAAHDLLVINRTDERRHFHRDAISFLKEILGDDNVMCIRADEAVNESFASIEPLSIYAPSSAALADIDALTIATIAKLAEINLARDEADA